MSDFGKATPRPWAVGMVTRYTDGRAPERHAIDDDYDRRSVSTLDMRSDVFWPGEAPSAEDAALIVAAVNGYDAAQARIAELEKALRLVLEQRDLSIQGRLHPMGELEIIALARATLAQEPQP